MAGMRSTRNIDLTEGNIAQRLLLFSLPILLGNLFQTLYNNVDSLVVGNFVGKEALAAVNTCTPVANLLIGFFLGLSTGASVIYSRNFGARQYHRFREAVHTTVCFSTLLGLSMAVLGVLLVPQILWLINCPADIYDYTRDYLRIYIAGIMFTAFYNVGAAVLRSVGDSQSPFLALVIASITNIILDIVFVVAFGMEVTGVALATVLSQILSVGFIVRRLLTMDEKFRFDFRELRIDPPVLRETIAVGFPAGIQSCLIALSNMVVNRYINGFGSSYMAGIGVAQKIDRFIGMPIQAVGLSITTFISQNVGAGRKERTKKGILIGYLLCCGAILMMGIPIRLNAAWLIGLFNRDPDVVRTGADMMSILMPFYFAMAANQLFAGVLRGFGYSANVMFASIFGMIVCRQIFLYVTMSVNRSIWNVYYGYPVGWMCAAAGVILIYLYYQKTGKLDRQFERPADGSAQDS